jgi:two-component system, chemotaxis family, CheB/CheR fusion protein
MRRVRRQCVKSKFGSSLPVETVMASNNRRGGAAASRGKRAGPRRTSELRATPAESPPSAAPTAIVGVGASAGGIEAFTALLKEMPPDSGLAFVFVQHLAPTHASMLAEILQRATSMRVLEVHDEPVVERNCVYVIPPARVMTIKSGRLALTPRGQAPHHPVDEFFDSLAATQGHRAIGVVLSGTATDGTAGLAAIKAAGGITIAQDSSALYDGMPRSALAAGRVDFVLPPAAIARELARIASHPYLVDGSREAARRAKELDQIDQIDRILVALRKGTGVDFSQYKSNTLHRRVRRRMALLKISDADEYAHFLKRNPSEVEALYQDILISVTTFFRNPEAFQALKAKVFPRLLKDRGRHDPIRVWVLGCATGEEAYSLAIALTEYISESGVAIPLMVYATDLNNVGIEKARSGLYPKSIASDISPERLRRFFIEVDGGYRVAKAIRDVCIFARHNVLGDPPFSRMDLISCRNVMIYMEAGLQRKLLPLLHYALKPTGVLFLGPSETIGASRDMFELEDAKAKIYSKKPVAPGLEHGFPLGPYTPSSVEARSESAREAAREHVPDVQRGADRVLLARYVPAGVLVNENHEVLQFRGDTGQYLAPAPGKASLNLLKMAREGLLVALRALLQRARREDAAVREEGVRIKANGGYTDVTLAVIPLGRPNTSERCYWVLFENPAPALPAAGAPAARRARRRPAGPAGEPEETDKDKQINRLLQELSATRDYLQSVIEQQEAANEELQSANEEVQSANEELQSINEELETSREEIQSSNEELTTVNEELQNRNEELNRANSDLNNLFGSLQMAIVMVGQDLRIRRFTPMAEKLFKLIETDIGRPIGDIKLSLTVPDLPNLLAEAIDQVKARELEVQDQAGRWYQLRIRPYRTLDNRIDGAVVLLFDIDSLKQSQGVLERQAKLLEQTHEAVFVRELNGTIVFWNRGAERLYGFSKEEALGRMSHELLGKTAVDRSQINQALKSEGRWMGEIIHRTRDGRELMVESLEVLVAEADRRLVLSTNRDVTERKRLEETLRRRVDELAAADRHKSEFLAVLAHELRNPLAPLRNGIEILKSVSTTDPRGARARELIERQARTLTRLVDDLLDTARISRGQVQLRREAVALQHIVARAVETAREAIDSRRHRLKVSLPAEPLAVIGDATRLEQVIANLLHNAAKYTPEQGEIIVSATKTNSGSAPEAVVSVRDTGIGISAEMLPRVFDLFTQADRSLAHSQGGLGIGLSLVRSLVELHGGRVAASSEGLGKGSEFSVYLPVADA